MTLRAGERRLVYDGKGTASGPRRQQGRTCSHQRRRRRRSIWEGMEEGFTFKKKRQKVGLKLNEWEEGKERGWQNAREELRRTKLERDDEGMQ